jgi:hypothetical protein
MPLVMTALGIIVTTHSQELPILRVTTFAKFTKVLRMQCEDGKVAQIWCHHL